MISFKSDVRIRGLAPQTVLAIAVANDVYRTFGTGLVVTSANDGKHKDGSHHYSGLAVDLRIKNVPEREREPLVTRLRQVLAPVGYDVLWEARGTPNEHVHIEYDPKE